MFLPWGPAVLRYQVEGFHFLSLWAGSWPRGTISLLAPAGLSTQPMGDTTCSTTAPDGAALGPRRKGCVFVLVCIKYLRVTRKDFCSRGTELRHYLRTGWNGTAETHRRCGVKVWFDEIVAQARIPPLSHTHTHIRSHRMSVRQWAVLTLNWISLSLSLSSTRRVTFPFRAEERYRKPIQQPRFHSHTDRQWWAGREIQRDRGSETLNSESSHIPCSPFWPRVRLLRWRRRDRIKILMGC